MACTDVPFRRSWTKARAMICGHRRQNPLTFWGVVQRTCCHFHVQANRCNALTMAYVSQLNKLISMSAWFSIILWWSSVALISLGSVYWGNRNTDRFSSIISWVLIYQKNIKYKPLVSIWVLLPKSYHKYSSVTAYGHFMFPTCPNMWAHVGAAVLCGIFCGLKCCCTAPLCNILAKFFASYETVS